MTIEAVAIVVISSVIAVLPLYFLWKIFIRSKPKRVFGDVKINKNEKNIIIRQVLILIMSSVIMGALLPFLFLLAESLGLNLRTTPTPDMVIVLIGFTYAVIISVRLTKRLSLRFCYFIASGVIQYISFVLTVLIRIFFFWPDW